MSTKRSNEKPLMKYKIMLLQPQTNKDDFPYKEKIRIRWVTLIVTHTTTVANGGRENPSPSLSTISLSMALLSTKHLTRTAMPTPNSTVSCVRKKILEISFIISIKITDQIMKRGQGYRN